MKDLKKVIALKGKKKIGTFFVDYSEIDEWIADFRKRNGEDIKFQILLYTFR